MYDAKVPVEIVYKDDEHVNLRLVSWFRITPWSAKWGEQKRQAVT